MTANETRSKLYLVGGHWGALVDNTHTLFDGKDRSFTFNDAVFEFDCATLAWKQLVSDPERIAFEHATVLVGGSELWIFGTSRVRACLCFNLLTNKFTEPLYSEYHGVASQGVAFVCKTRGASQIVHATLNAMHVYAQGSPNADFRVGPPTQNGAVMIVDSHIVFCGGSTKKTKRGNGSWQFEQKYHNWEDAKFRMNNARVQFDIVEIDAEKKYAIGGDLGGSIEEFDVLTATWSVKAHLPPACGTIVRSVVVKF